jgi:hypothetical protein
MTETLERLRDRASRYLEEHWFCILATSGPEGSCIAAAQYKSVDFTTYLAIPQADDAIYNLEVNPCLALAIFDHRQDKEVWQGLEYLGKGKILDVDERSEVPSGLLIPEEMRGLYAIVKTIPRRIYLVDWSQSWGYRDTIDFPNQNRR